MLITTLAQTKSCYNDLIKRGNRGHRVYIVIFRATVRTLDAEYSAVAERMRELALGQFGCIEFHSITEGLSEISLSYWPSEESIRTWKAHPEHVLAQQAGRERWYKTYSVQVAEIKRAYHVAT